MRIQCENCGCIMEIGYKHDKIHLLIEELKKKTRVVLCDVVDDEGYIIASELGNFFNKKLERKIISFYKAIEDLASKTDQLIDFKGKIEIFELIEQFDKNLKGFYMMMLEIVNDISLITVVPSWLNIAKVSIEFKKTVEQIRELLVEKPDQKTQDVPEYSMVHFDAGPLF